MGVIDDAGALVGQTTYEDCVAASGEWSEGLLCAEGTCSMPYTVAFVL